ncbi:hypothetical protein F511_33671 [Dorcoceras hygrometricum]|uniref:Uncharacterized protein n=1 Tax=Dorcoceras hygrometricum TaxID=472368 RepID=A0A2Z7CFK2_9LAMI|nr:hypothetical protein F511_33671 [Dorcoceras hygrometricum]
MIRWPLAADATVTVGICSDHLGEEIQSVKIFVGFLVQTDEGVEILVVDRIRRRSSRSTVEVPIPSWNWLDLGA